eukprot:379429-Hanusia_phi.AAC.4
MPPGTGIPGPPGVLSPYNGYCSRCFIFPLYARTAVTVLPHVLPPTPPPIFHHTGTTTSFQVTVLRQLPVIYHPYHQWGTTPSLHSLPYPVKLLPSPAPVSPLHLGFFLNLSEAPASVVLVLTVS